MTLFGASPAETAGEVWGIAAKGGGSVAVRYAPGSGWTVGSLLDASGEPLKGFTLDTPEAFRHSQPSPLGAQITAAGSGAALGYVGSGSSARQVVLISSPGEPFKEAPAPEEGGVLHAGEKLFDVNRPPLLAALDDTGGKAGAFVVPAGSGPQNAVLHWDGEHWTRETIEVPVAGSSQFEVLAIGASSPGNAWLLARMGGSVGTLTLLRRQPGSGVREWRAVSTRPGGEAGAAIELAGETLEEPSPEQAQLLTVSSSGVWVDGRMRGSKAPASAFFAPEGESNAGSFTGLWCEIPASSPGATSQLSEECANHPLAEALPTDYSRSFAWPGSGGYGERVLTGAFDGRLMRLVNGRYELVNSLGSEPGDDPGASYGAAFSSGSDGWLGKRLLPVHITPAADAAPSRLAPWPVPFRFALTALAPAPGQPVGAEASEVLAVGDRGEVARYHPGQGWFPETLPAPGGKRETTRLRAVAWPVPGRAFAVGDSKEGVGQMWLWRGETGLWEKDPAMPLNFRGNLLGVGFDPNDSARGYAVGQQGVLLRYGKSWTQEEEQSLPPAARGASFTSIAFAGSEAIVAWRKLQQPGQNSYAGGIIENSGSGWHEDEAAAGLLGANAVPWALAALPDGGAAFSAKGATGGATIYERNGPGAAWQGAPYPGGFAPGALTVFREGGALRAIGAGSEPGTFLAEQETPPPAGFPPILVDPYPLVSDPNRGVLRQTATGWSDEEHELNEAREPPGGYTFYDTPYVPDPVSAVLVDPSGAHGWAVGGFVDNQHALLDTGDIYRYPSEGTTPTGLRRSTEATSSAATSIAIGGGAACAAPCATRADTGIGPAAWTQNAIAEAGEIPGVGAFVYTGPGVTTGEISGPRLFPVPWQEEESYYLARSAAAKPPVCVVPAPSDREGSGEGSLGAFETAFAQTSPEVASSCRSAGAEHGSYAFQDQALRVIVIDTSRLLAGQRALPENEIPWLSSELEAAGGHAIVIGNADLPREYAEGHAAARELIATIEGGNAAAYFFESPEQNVQEPLGGPGGVKAYGSGTLGYVNVLNEEQSGFIGQSGFLVAEVENTPERGRYPVHVKLVPNIAELATEAQQGTLLRRSPAAAFAGLARRPRAGNRAHNQQTDGEVAPYIQIPANCLGSNCARGIEPEYRFSSEDTRYGEFVKRDLNSPEPNAVLHDEHGNPISQEAEGGKDGLLCAFNATPPGHPLTITLKVANLAYQLPVTIQAGSVRQPCGTSSLGKPKATGEASTQPPPPGENPPSGNTAPRSVTIPPPAPLPASVPAPAPHLAAAHTPPPHFLAQAVGVPFIPAFVPVPLPTPARPTPPSGTSAVTSPVEVAQREEEEEAAPESVDAAAAYQRSEHELPPAYLIGLVV
ncbi:MAG: hypothetical protein ACYDC2_09905, partial [Solirubrobacteraceae bacterium]